MAVWRRRGGVLRSAFWRGKSLAGGPGPSSCRGIGRALAVGFGRLRFGLRGAGVPNEFTQELELGQEELPDYIPTWRVKKEK